MDICEGETPEKVQKEAAQARSLVSDENGYVIHHLQIMTEEEEEEDS